MPIGWRQTLNASGGIFVFPDTTASGAIREGAAVALISALGVARLIECSATSNGASFQGFAAYAAADGDNVGVITLRGSRVSPIFVGGGGMTVNASLYLSATPGEVVHTPPPSGYVLRVGDAYTPTTMFMNTDIRVVRP